MKITIYPYRLPLRAPWPGRKEKQLQSRQGWLVRIQYERWVGWGDCAPLSSAGSEPSSQARLCLRHFAQRVHTLRELHLHITALRHQCPAACFAMESALLAIRAQQRCQALRHLWSAQAKDWIDFNMVAPSLYHLPASSPTTIIKLKVGRKKTATELRYLHRLCSRLPTGTRIRLDANGCWNMAQARTFIHGARDLPIESLEEPLSSQRIQDWQCLQAEAPFPLAWDESMTRLPLAQLLHPRAPKRLILKPTVLGGLEACFQLARTAQNAGKHCLVTSCLESSIGLWACAQLAAAIDTLGLPQTHGLGTFAWLQRDPMTPPANRGQRLYLSTGIGLGLPHEPHLQLLDVRP